MQVVLLAYGDPEICKRSLQSVMEVRGVDHIDLIINPSEHDVDEFERFACSQLESGRVRNILRFDENISNNAYSGYLTDMRRDLTRMKRIVISDCDVLVPPDVLEEQNAVLDRNPDVFACGTLTDVRHWNDEIRQKESELKRLAGLVDRGDHYLGATGFWFVLFDCATLLNTVDRMSRNGVSFVDGSIKSFAQGLFGKRWVAAKRARARELSREQTDYYGGRTSVIETLSQFSPEPPNARFAIWNHNKSAGYKLITRDGATRRQAPKLSPVSRRFRAALNDDAAVAALRESAGAPANGYLVASLPAQKRAPGVYFIYGRRPRTGLPSYDDGKSVIYLGPEFEPAHCPRLADIGAATAFQTVPKDEASALLRTLAQFLVPGGQITTVIFDWERIEKLESQPELLELARSSKFMSAALTDMYEGAAARRRLETSVSVHWLLPALEEAAASAGLRASFLRDRAPIVRVTLTRVESGGGPLTGTGDVRHTVSTKPKSLLFRSVINSIFGLSNASSASIRKTSGV